MYDIDDITSRLIEHPAKMLYYSISEDKFLDRKVTFAEYESNGDLCGLFRAKVCWDAARRNFMAKHHAIFPDLPANCPVKRWNALIEENHLEKEWFAEFRLAIAENVTRFGQVFGLHEVEAEPELYLQIKKQLKILEAKHYERKYSDMVLFHIGCDYEWATMTILGNAGKVLGVAFYPSDKTAANYLLVQNQERLRIDPETANSIATMVSFYFEKEPLYGMTFPDPYESNFHFTSVFLCQGIFMQCRLPKSLAIRAINYLETVNREMANFASKKNKLRSDTFYDVILDAGQITVEKTDPYEFYCGQLPFDLTSIDFLDPSLKFKKGGSWDATIRYLPGCNEEAIEGDERTTNFTYVAMMCDHDTGEVLIHSLGSSKDYRPFDDLVKNLSKDLQKTTVPKTIYVNNYFDLEFFTEFFDPYIFKGKVKLEIAKGELFTDRSFDVLRNFLLDKIENQDEEGETDLFKEKKVNKA